MIFPNLESEDTVQVKDKTRLSAVKSFVSKGENAVTKVEIEPEAAAGFIEVTGLKSSDWFLDWEYSTDGNKTVSLRITAGISGPITITKTMAVISSANDALFSNDAELAKHEHDILKYVKAGRNTFLDIHRRAQAIILAWLDERGAIDSEGNRLTKAAIVDKQEVIEWATYVALRLIFRNQSNQVQDIFDQRSNFYQALEDGARTRNRFKFDYNDDGIISDGEFVQFQSAEIIRG